MTVGFDASRRSPSLIFSSQEVTDLDAKVYEVLSLAMRYFFTFVGAMIVWRSFSWLRKDRRQKHRRLKQLPDAGTIGIFTVHEGSKALKPGEIIPVPHEGVLGYLRTCDVVVPVDDVATIHLDFTFADGEGLYVYPRRGCDVRVDGELLISRRDSRRRPMQHGSVLEVGQAVLQLGVFAGLDVQEARPSLWTPEDVPSVSEPPAPDGQEVFYPPQYQRPADPYRQPVDPYVQPGNPATRPDPYAPSVQPWPQGDPHAPHSPMNQPWQGGDGHAP